MRNGTISPAEWRFQHGCGPEPRSYRGRTIVWSCPAGCHRELTEAEGGMHCAGCDTTYTWARLAAEQ